jgi:glycosyltransferase involved in cell wall biosynthesis
VCAEDEARNSRRPLLSVVVPVYNGGDEIVDNVAIVRAAVTADLDDRDVEIVVVSDGSIDGSTEMLLAARDDLGMRVIHYDRNLGKGYAVKLGALASTGEWVAIVDADLDLHPSAIPSYLETARRENLDFAVGSKRHPDSIVNYPKSRRVASWMYQQLNRILFRLDVRDTQVGLKVFRGEVADEIVPLLLVKQFAFDLELLAVGRALGYGRMKEMPIRLDYRFTGLRSAARSCALVDTLAIFYRFRILRTYQRKRAIIGAHGRMPESPPLVTLIDGESVAASLDYPRLAGASGRSRSRGASGARRPARASRGGRASSWQLGHGVGSVLRGPGGRRSRRPDCVAAGHRFSGASLQPRSSRGSEVVQGARGSARQRWDGLGHPLAAAVVRRRDYLDAREAHVEDADLARVAAERRRRTIYTPDTRSGATAAHPRTASAGDCSPGTIARIRRPRDTGLESQHRDRSLGRPARRSSARRRSRRCRWRRQDRRSSPSPSTASDWR